MTTSPIKRYDAFSMILHWLSAVAVVLAFALGPGDFGRLTHEGLDPGLRADIRWHETLGMAVFLLTLLRLLWIAVRPTPPTHRLAGWLGGAARWVRVLLWGLLLATPLAALLTLTGEGQPLTLVAGLRLQTIPLVHGWRLATLLDWGQVHGLLGDAILWLAGLHAAAALGHHFIWRDDVLKAMLPDGKR